jgi:hypothetical protein
MPPVEALCRRDASGRRVDLTPTQSPIR